ncbi:MAG TPA: M12 family metallo-peptidase, partial [Pyrinomonadaceae bacterium]|nr:M12 family metallo-peptidase [Pyrinomonadaceae bacterium]
MKRPPLLLLLIAPASTAAFLLYAANTSARSPKKPKRLFDPVPADKSAEKTPEASGVRSRVSVAAVREQEISVNFSSIDFSEARELSLPLLGGVSYTASRVEPEGFEASPGGGFVWRGKISAEGGWAGDVTLSAEGGALSGLIYSPEGVYEIVPQKDFTHLLVQIDQSRFPPCGGALPAFAASETVATDAATAATDAATLKVEMAPATFGASDAADDGGQLDVLVIYTSNVRTALGGTTQAEAFAHEAVNTTNTAYINSDIHTRLRLVGALEVGFAETGDLTAALTWAANDETVKAARNSVRADLVAFIAERGGNLCGVGRLMTRSSLGPGFQHAAYSVSARGCSVGNLTFAHEIGHNQGCQHNPENGGPPDVLAYPYAFGHYEDGLFRTVMSYSDPCT